LKHNNLCILKSHKTLKEFLNKELLFSSNLIKKTITNKKFLQKSVAKREEITIPMELLNSNQVNPDYDGIEIEVIEETDDFIVLNKPEGVHGHPLDYSENGTVLNFVRSKFVLEDLGLSSIEKERGLLYRLDELTSGVLIYVKNPSLHEKLREDFSEVMKTKSYLAIVDGKLEIDSEVKNYLKGSGEKGSQVIVDDSGVRCISHIKSLKYNDESDTTVVQVALKTGFRHQIRVQLSHLGNPIHGDTLYGGKSSDRMYLHAFEYCLEGQCWRADKNLLFCNFLNLDSLSNML